MTILYTFFPINSFLSIDRSFAIYPIQMHFVCIFFQCGLNCIQETEIQRWLRQRHSKCFEVNFENTLIVEKIIGWMDVPRKNYWSNFIHHTIWKIHHSIVLSSIELLMVKWKIRRYLPQHEIRDLFEIELTLNNFELNTLRFCFIRTVFMVLGHFQEKRHCIVHLRRVLGFSHYFSLILARPFQLIECISQRSEKFQEIYQVTVIYSSLVVNVKSALYSWNFQKFTLPFKAIAIDSLLDSNDRIRIFNHFSSLFQQLSYNSRENGNASAQIKV